VGWCLSLSERYALGLYSEIVYYVEIAVSVQLVRITGGRQKYMHTGGSRGGGGSLDMFSRLEISRKCCSDWRSARDRSLIQFYGIKDSSQRCSGGARVSLRALRGRIKRLSRADMRSAVCICLRLMSLV